MRISLLVTVMLGLSLSATTILANNAKFFQEEKRGWLWFEEKPQNDKSKEDNKTLHIQIRTEMERATAENEQFAKELELVKHMMIRQPDNIAYIKLYKENEQRMLDAAMALAQNYAMVNMLYPHLADNLKQPQNMYSRSLKQDQEQKI